MILPLARQNVTLGVRREDEMKHWWTIVSLAFVVGCAGTPEEGQRPPTPTEIQSLLPKSDTPYEITEIRKAPDGSFLVLFGSADMKPATFENGRMIRPPGKVVWTNAHWELRSSFDHRNPGNRKTSANQASEAIGASAPQPQR
jgi:hypothetical protein